MRIGASLGVALLLAGCTGFAGIEDMTDGSSVGGSSSGSASGSTASSDPTVATASGSSTTNGSTSVTGEPTTSPTTTDDPTDETTTGPSSTTGDSSSSSSSSDSSSSSSSSSSTGNMGDDLLGMACNDDMDCDMGAGQECCTDSHCVDTCMVPCGGVEDCPVAGMGCEHGYCLFPCDNDDNDCAMWPGYTCEHGGSFCEIV